MNLAESVDAAVDCCFDIVCSPRAFSMIRDRARKREAQRNLTSIQAGRGPSMMRAIDIVWHAKQTDPEMLAFDDWRSFREYLAQLDTQPDHTLTSAGADPCP